MWSSTPKSRFGIGDTIMIIPTWQRMVTSPDSSTDLLQAAYEQLAFDQGALLSAMREPQAAALKDWVNRGDWQSLAAQVGAESIFFVDRDPVIVFAKTEDNSPEV